MQNSNDIVITGADKVNDFFFLGQDEEEQDENSRRAAELFNAKAKQPLEKDKVSFAFCLIKECQSGSNPKRIVRLWTSRCAPLISCRST